MNAGWATEARSTGFSTRLAFLSDAALGVVVVSAVDGTNNVTGRVADAALALMLAVRDGVPLPGEPMPATEAIHPALALELEGTYGAGVSGLEFDERNGELYMTPLRGGATVQVRARRDTLIVDDRLAFGTRFLRDGEDLIELGEAPARHSHRPPQGLPDRRSSWPTPRAARAIIAVRPST